MANLTENENIPINYLCPISLQIMNDPVIVCENGHSFDRLFIQKWIDVEPICPKCKETIVPLIPNRALKDSIEEYLTKKESSDLKVSSESSDSMLKQSFTQIYVEQLINTIKLACEDNFDKRKPVNLIFVLDVSYSMNELIKAIKDDKNNNERHGFTRLDLVKFVTNTIIHLLDKGDKISIILYSSECIELVDISNGQMTDHNKELITQKINQIKPNGCTYMWDGICTAFRSVKLAGLNKYNSNIILLTDGCPTEGRTARGIVPTLESYIRKNGIPCPIHSFLFGYDGNPELMDKISELTGGTFGFIPDASMMSTFIINKITCILNTCVNVIEFEYSYSCDEDKLNEIFNGYSIVVNTTEKTCTVNLGSLQYDLTKSFDFDNELIKLTHIYCDGLEQNIKSVSESNIFRTSSQTCINCRIKFIDIINKLIIDVDQVLKHGSDLARPRFSIDTQITEFSELTNNVDSKSDAEYINNLIFELQKEISIAFSNVNHLKVWVLPYLISLKNAHLHQYCSDFKNHSIKMYKGHLFDTLKDKLSDTFDMLPPPKASRRNENTSDLRKVGLRKVAERFTRPAPALTSMSVYNDRYGGCFTGDCKVETKYCIKEIKDLIPNDIVKTDKGFSRVNHIVRTKYPTGTIMKLHKLSDDNGCITAWHPVRLNSKWEFPIKKLDIYKRRIDKVYNLILEKDHIVYLNGVEVVTLGHGFKGDVIEHDFFGNMDKIKEHYVTKSVDGFIELSHDQITRNEEGLVNRLI